MSTGSRASGAGYARQEATYASGRHVYGQPQQAFRKSTAKTFPLSNCAIRVPLSALLASNYVFTFFLQFSLHVCLFCDTPTSSLKLLRKCRQLSSWWCDASELWSLQVQRPRSTPRMAAHGRLVPPPPTALGHQTPFPCVAAVTSSLGRISKHTTTSAHARISPIAAPSDRHSYRLRPLRVPEMSLVPRSLLSRYHG